MKRAPTALRAIGGFGIAVAVLSVAATAAVVVLAPEPVQRQMTGAEAVAALRQGSPTLERRYGPAPEGQRAVMLEGVITAALQKRNGTVRVVWPDAGYPGPKSMTFRMKDETLSNLRKTGSTSMILVGKPGGTFEMVSSTEVDAVVQASLLNMPMPAFTAAVRQDDGRWLTVSPIEPFLTGWQRNVLMALAISLLLLAPLAWVFARRLTRPFRALSHALGDSAEPIPQTGPRELREAADTIAAMRTRLVDAATERTRILTAVAHDLRTPLTGLRLRVENVAEPQRGRMIGDIDRMQAMIGEVLGFAQDTAAASEPINLRPFVAQILAEMDHADDEIALLPGPEAAVRVPPLAFRRVIENLIRNALDYAGSGTIAIGHDGAEVVIVVCDTGPGIPAEDRERLVRPFERGEASRNRATGGTGLGLSIVQEFAVRYRGGFALKQALGGGTLAELRLPIP